MDGLGVLFGRVRCLAAHDPRVVLALSSNSKIDWLEIKWLKPSERTKRFTDLPVDCYVTIVEGKGKWKKALD